MAVLLSSSTHSGLYLPTPPPPCFQKKAFPQPFSSLLDSAFSYHQNARWFWCWKSDSTCTTLKILYSQRSLLIISQSHSYSLVFSTQPLNRNFPWASSPCNLHSLYSTREWSHLLPNTDDFKFISSLKPLSCAPDSDFKLLIWYFPWVFFPKTTFSVFQ